MSIKQMISDAKVMIGSNYISLLLYTFIFLAVSYTIKLIPAYIPMPIVGLIIALIILIFSVPFAIAYRILILQVIRGDKANPATMFKETISQFKNAWEITLYTVFVKLLFVPLILFICGAGYILYMSYQYSSGNIADVANYGGPMLLAYIAFIAGFVWLIILLLRYSLTYYIKYDNNDESMKDVFASSKELMNGSKLSYGFVVLVVVLLAILIETLTGKFTTNQNVIEAVSMCYTLIVTPFISVLPVTIYEEKK